MSDFMERRRSQRKNFSELPLVFSLLLSEPIKSDIPFRVEARNMSLQGLKFQANQKIPLFAEIKIQLFENKAKGDSLRLRAKVVRVEEVDTGRSEKIFGIAAEFQALSEDEKRKLAHFFPAKAT